MTSTRLELVRISRLRIWPLDHFALDVMGPQMGLEPTIVRAENAIARLFAFYGMAHTTRLERAFSGSTIRRLDRFGFVCMR